MSILFSHISASGLRKSLSAEELMLSNCGALVSPLDSKEIKPVNPKGNQSWIFIGNTDAQAETPILWPTDAMSRLIEKDPDAGKIEGRRKRGQQRMRCLHGITDLMDMSMSKLQEIVKDREACRSVLQSVQFSCSVISNSLQPMDHSRPGLPVHHQLPEFTQTHVRWVGDAIQPSHPLSSPSPPALKLSHHQALFQWVSFSHQVARVLELQLQHQSFQWTPRTDLL